MLAGQIVDGHLSLHSDGEAAALGLPGAPIEGPTHFSQVDPLAVLAWGSDWFRRGCISAHFQNMVTGGEAVQATLATSPTGPARLQLHKDDGTPVLTGTASVGPDYGQTALEARRARLREAGELYIVDKLEIGMHRDAVVSMSFDTRSPWRTSSSESPSRIPGTRRPARRARPGHDRSSRWR